MYTCPLQVDVACVFNTEGQSHKLHADSMYRFRYTQHDRLHSIIQSVSDQPSESLSRCASTSLTQRVSRDSYTPNRHIDHPSYHLMLTHATTSGPFRKTGIPMLMVFTLSLDLKQSKIHCQCHAPMSNVCAYTDFDIGFCLLCLN